MTPPRLSTPSDTSSLDFWIDEAIWGHRLYDEQTPWMTLLEMLNVLLSRAPEVEGAYEDPDFQGVAYRPVQRMALRQILFNNPYMEDIRQRGGSDDAQWDSWFGKMKRLQEASGGETDFAYLRQVFPARGARSESFKDFAQVVKLLRATAIEGESNKRWTSKFVFPYGPACLFPDLRLDAQGVLSMDRRFFARTGELVYLMLCRSGRGDAVFAELQRVVLDPKAVWNRVVECLQPPAKPNGQEARQATRTGFLPYRALPEYAALADDMLALLRAGLPGYDALPHLVDLIGLHLVLYLLKRAAEWAPEDGEVRMVLEIIAPKRTTVRNLAVESFQTNGRRSAKAVDAFITREVEQSAAWGAACEIADDDERQEAMRGVLWETVRLREAKSGEGSEMFRRPASEHVLETLRESARKRHEQHLGDVHMRYAQAIGLASKRGAQRVRYAPNDQLLKTLVLTVVKGERMEFQEFLQQLWERYRMVIGHHQAKALLDGGESDQVAFEENARRLEMRLASLGLLRRLSDACAFVENPMGGEP